MQLRVARHTNNLTKIINFYTEILGFEILGQFENHSNYNGVFLGFPNLDWHLEFTTSTEKTNAKPDKDDLLVLYIKTQAEIDEILSRASTQNLLPNKSKNPYWHQNGVELLDPDGFGVMLAFKK